MIYRKHRESTEDHWHFNSQCPLWPKSDYVEIRLVKIHRIDCSAGGA